MSVTAFRRDDLLRDALGPDVARLLAEDGTTDVMRNADGRMWVDRIGDGRTDVTDTTWRMSDADADTALRILASHCGEPLTRKSPILSATLPSGERIAGTIAPVTRSATFAIRKPPRVVFDLGDFAGGMGEEASMSGVDIPHGEDSTLRRAVDERRNILIAGGTGSGKTSLLSSLLQLDSVRCDRVVAIEDVKELALAGIPDHVRFVTSPEVDMRQLVELSLRFRPDRIVLGEVRSGPAALEMITAMNTGHSGSFGTIHANSAREALVRLENLCARVCNQTPKQEISDAIDVVCFVVRTKTGRAIREIWTR